MMTKDEIAKIKKRIKGIKFLSGYDTELDMKKDFIDLCNTALALWEVVEAAEDLGQPIPMGCFSMMYPKDKVAKLGEALKKLRGE